MQSKCRTSSLLECYAEPQLILCKVQMNCLHGRNFMQNMYEMMDKMYKMEVSSVESVYLKNSTAGNGQKEKSCKSFDLQDSVRREREIGYYNEIDHNRL